MNAFRHAVRFLISGAFWIACIFVVGGVLEGSAYWVVGGVLALLALASNAYFVRQGMKASIRGRAREPAD